MKAALSEQCQIREDSVAIDFSEHAGHQYGLDTRQMQLQLTDFHKSANLVGLSQYQHFQLPQIVFH